MKLAALFCFCFTIAHSCFSQAGEFETYSNGYIYDEKTMGQLRHIVDSLNFSFQGCDLSRRYKAISQACAHYIVLDTGNIREAKKDLEKNMPFEQFMTKFPACKSQLDILVIRFMYKDDDDHDVVKFLGLPVSSHFWMSSIDRDDPAFYKKDLNQKWLVEFTEKSSYSKESLVAYFFTSSFKSQPLPEKYSQLIQYSDCLIDTNGIIYKNSASFGSMHSEDYENSKVGQFMNFIHTATQHPDPDAEGERNYEAMEAWNKVSHDRIDSLFHVNKRCAFMLKEAVKEALVQGNSDDEFEYIVGRFSSKKTELELKRSRRVVGFCSQDQGPRLHAREIAILSAETVQWDIFLRAHLDIMNDNFDRVSDGNYAWAGRKTYIQELEALNINVLDLLIGIALRVENPSKNHYYGDNDRLGRALAETHQPEIFEQKVLSMIKDKDLDDFNRLLMFYLFHSYKSYAVNDENQDEITSSVYAASQLLPDYLAQKFKD